jgi:hypothetical protein
LDIHGKRRLLGVDMAHDEADRHPPLTRSDAWLLAALTEGSHDGCPVNLRDFVNDADWLNRLIPTFDEMSFGLPRLVAAGFLVVGYDPKEGLVFRATPNATKLRDTVKAKSLGDVLNGVGEAVGAAPYPEPEPAEDRSLGRLPGLESDALDTAIQEHGERIERWSKPFIVAAHALTKRQNRKSGR